MQRKGNVKLFVFKKVPFKLHPLDAFVHVFHANNKHGYYTAYRFLHQQSRSKHKAAKVSLIYS